MHTKWLWTFVLVYVKFNAVTYGSFKDALAGLDYVALNIWLINSWIGEDVEGNVCCLIWGTFPAFSWKDWWNLWKPAVSLAGLNSIPPEHEWGVLLTSHEIWFKLPAQDYLDNTESYSWDRPLAFCFSCKLGWW